MASERLIDAYISGLGLITIPLGMTAKGFVFGCGPAPAGPEVEAATFYITTQRLADRLLEAAGPDLAGLAKIVGLAELAAELYAIAEEVNVQVLTESEIQAMAIEAVERIDREFVELNRSGGLKAINKRYPEMRLAAAAEGRKVPRYQFWLFGEKRRMVAEIAAATAEAGRIGVVRDVCAI
jgi:hypothetical protein